MTFDYARCDDGRIRVVNICHKGTPDGPVEMAETVATVVAPGKLEVSFVPWLPFAKGDYWVLHVDPTCSVAVVGAPAGKTGWILARRPELSAAAFDRAVSVLEATGYDTAKLEKTAQ